MEEEEIEVDVVVNDSSNQPEEVEVKVIIEEEITPPKPDIKPEVPEAEVESEPESTPLPTPTRPLDAHVTGVLEYGDFSIPSNE